MNTGGWEKVRKKTRVATVRGGNEIWPPSQIPCVCVCMYT